VFFAERQLSLSRPDILPHSLAFIGRDYPYRCDSGRLTGNLQVRFLEGWAPAMAPGHSTVMIAPLGGGHLDDAVRARGSVNRSTRRIGVDKSEYEHCRESYDVRLPRLNEALTRECLTCAISLILRF
jgi:hypothetical protein